MTGGTDGEAATNDLSLYPGTIPSEAATNDLSFHMPYPGAPFRPNVR